MSSVKISADSISKSRIVESISKGKPTSDGAGVNLSRVLQQEHQMRLDPFLLLDEFRSDDASDYIAGFPDHPHRGFETVTYMLAGNMQHTDSSGHTGNLVAGSIQWMTAGRGIIHSEMPQQENGLMHGFQLWVNLPAEHKLCEPRYQEYPPENLPRYQLDNGGEVTVVAGTSHGTAGVIEDIQTQPVYIDIKLPPAVAFSHQIPAAHNAFVYVIEGNIYIGPQESASALNKGDMGILSNGDNADGVAITTCDSGARLLLLAGQPVNEPIVQWGPFVMNSEEEIEQALQDYRNGTLTGETH